MNRPLFAPVRPLWIDEAPSGAVRPRPAVSARQLQDDAAEKLAALHAIQRRLFLNLCILAVLVLCAAVCIARLCQP